jgi:hypothetical protein
LPDGIFPLPVAGLDLKDHRKGEAEAKKAYVETRRQRLAQLSADLASHHQATDELLNTFERTGAQPVTNPTTNRAGAAGAQPPVGFMLPGAAAKALTDSTKTVLKGLGVAETHIDVAKSVTLLERQSTEIARQLYADSGAIKSMVRIGNRIIPSDALVGDLPVAIYPSPADPRTPGVCPPIIDTTPPIDSVTVMAAIIYWQAKEISRIIVTIQPNIYRL